jgi:hypothetical protein
MIYVFFFYIGCYANEEVIVTYIEDEQYRVDISAN